MFPAKADTRHRPRAQAVLGLCVGLGPSCVELHYGTIYGTLLLPLLLFW